MSARIILVLSLVLISRIASAQELKSLQDAILDGAEETYPLVRCAGLYLSVIEWAGEDRLGTESADKSKLVVANLFGLASEMRKPTLGDNAETSVRRDIRAISDAYLLRYRQNYALSGEAFGQDPIWLSDNDVCVQILGS